MAEYNSTVEECDVEGKEALTQYRQKREEWQSWLHGDDEHSVMNQIYNMMWSDTVYRILVNQARLLGNEAPTSARNGALGQFIDQGYISTQVLSIRRLVDPEARRAERQPISIKRVLKDIKRHKELLTRENFVCGDGLPYDFKAERDKWFEKVAVELGHEPQEQTEEDKALGDAWDHSKRLHGEFDRLSGVKPADRKRSDQVSDEVFTQLSNLIAIQEINEVGDFADKFIAHAADPTSRATISQEGMTVSMAKLSTCHQALFSLTQAISGQLLWGTASPAIPHPQFDVLEHLDTQWLSDENLEQAREAWNERIDEVEGWRPPKLEG
ncbi:hypothetical protein [Terasakiella sp. SH-1]|uniref:hypothetical protein n=1 Tax=Terasakiella sp. SH-1 TaxID=2560057 RepID=UPI001072F116|nr:hypothetical protein [Terasakiella sp. SH-1]